MQHQPGSARCASHPFSVYNRSSIKEVIIMKRFSCITLFIVFLWSLGSPALFAQQVAGYLDAGG